MIAHRGASAIELENSLAAFRAAAGQGADAVELDVHATQDGELVVHHDPSIMGLPIAQASMRDLSRLRLPNGEPLPTEHGYPARLVVPGLYGYVSATKWVVDLELTRFDRAEGYWTPLGWSAHGPIKTQSRIDVPRSGQDVVSNF